MPRASPPSNGSTTEREDSQSRPEQGKCNQGASNTLTCQVDTDKMVLLQTARIRVFNPERPTVDCSTDITVILDSGSQESYNT